MILLAVVEVDKTKRERGGAEHFSLDNSALQNLYEACSWPTMIQILTAASATGSRVQRNTASVSAFDPIFENLFPILNFGQEALCSN